MSTPNEIALRIAKALCEHPDLRIDISVQARWEAAQPSNLANVILTAADLGEKENQWSQEWPDEMGLWWLWWGDEDSEPFPVTIMYSGTSDEHFVAAGQWGWDTYQSFDELPGAWWMKCNHPEPPSQAIRNKPPQQPVIQTEGE